MEKKKCEDLQDKLEDKEKSRSSAFQVSVSTFFTGVPLFLSFLRTGKELKYCFLHFSLSSGLQTAYSLFLPMYLSFAD